MSDFVKYVVKLLGKGCPLWASIYRTLTPSYIEEYKTERAHME